MYMSLLLPFLPFREGRAAVYLERDDGSERDGHSELKVGVRL